MPSAHDLAVERMGDADRPSGGRRVGDDQAARLQRGQRAGAGQSGHQLERQRLAERDELDRLALLGVQAGHAPVDQLDQRGRDAGAPAQPPPAALGGQRAALQRADDQLAHVERVALADREGPALDVLLDRRAQRGLQQRAGLLLRQVLQLQPGGARVLPQRDHRVRRRLPAAHGGDDERGAGRGQMQDEGGRGGVEQMRVVDADDQRLAGGALAQRLDAAAQQLQAVVGARALGHQLGEGAQRDRRGGAGRVHPLRRGAARSRGGQQLARQSRLPDARRAADDGARAGRVLAREQQPLELVIPADERPEPGRSPGGP